MKLHSNLVRNALSRRDNKTYICSTCGEREAFVDYFKYEQIPSEEMEVEKDFHAKVKCDFHKYKTWHKEKDERERSQELTNV